MAQEIEWVQAPENTPKLPSEMLINKIYLPNLFDEPDYYKQWLMSLPFTDELSTDHCVGLETRNWILSHKKQIHKRNISMTNSDVLNKIKCI